MELPEACFFLQLADVLLGDATACHEGDAPCCLAVEAFQQLGALDGFGLLARSENAVKTQVDEGFQRLPGVGSAVKCAVACHAHARRARHQVAVFLYIDGTIGIEAAKHHAIDAQFAAHGNVSRHALHLQVGVEEVAATRTDNDVEARRCQHTACHLDFAIAGCRATLGDACTQLHTVGATLLSRKAGFHAVGADFHHEIVTFHRQDSVFGFLLPAITSRRASLLRLQQPG